MECTDCVAARVDYKSGRLALIVSVHCTATCDLVLTLSDFGTFIGTSVAGHAPSLSAGSCYVCSGIDKCTVLFCFVQKLWNFQSATCHCLKDFKANGRMLMLCDNCEIIFLC